jgi:hypothetical protein
MSLNLLDQIIIWSGQAHKLFAKLKLQFALIQQCLRLICRFFSRGRETYQDAIHLQSNFTDIL